MNAMRTLWAAAALTLLSLVAHGAPAAVLPRPAPELAINLGQGKQLKLSQYKGKPVVLAFILTYCSHCQKVMAALGKLHGEYAPRGLQVLATATEDMAASALPAFLRQFAPPFPVGYNTSVEAANFMQHSAMLAFYMPCLVFIDRDGMIQAQYEGRDAFLAESTVEKNIRTKLEQMMPAGAPVAPRKKRK
jgi:thiol-disulfide isomerase/thioredoxin